MTLYAKYFAARPVNIKFCELLTPSATKGDLWYHHIGRRKSFVVYESFETAKVGSTRFLLKHGWSTGEVYLTALLPRDRYVSAMDEASGGRGSCSHALALPPAASNEVEQK